MKKLALAIGLMAAFTIGAVVAVPAGGLDGHVGHAASADSSTALARSANLHLRSINQELYPDDLAVVDDWLCDGMTPCIRLSSR